MIETKKFRDLIPGDVVEIEDGTAEVLSRPEKGMLKGHMSVHIHIKKTSHRSWSERHA